MENYITKLEYLINLKKKEPAKLERDDFEHTWKQLVQETGFTPDAEKYLYSGLRFCSAKPFKDYMKTRDMMGALKELYSGKLFGDNCASTIQILYHLLALSINEFPDRLDVIGSLIQHIPSALLNKEGKMYGQAGRVIKKYFLDEIKSDAEIPTFVTLIDNGLNAGIAVDFANKLKTIIDGMDSDKFSKRCKDNIAKIFLWINPPKDTSSHESENILEHIEVSDEESDTKLVIQESPPENDQSEVNEIDTSEIPTEDQTIVKLRQKFSVEIEKLKKELLDVTVSYNTASTALSNYRVENEHIKKQISAIQREIEEAHIIIAESKKTISDLRIIERDLRTRVATLEEEIATKDQEIAQRIELIEMLRRDRSKQSDESQKRIASKLRSYYADYIDAQELEMSVDLGENMRDQLGEVFKILMSAGISVK